MCSPSSRFVNTACPLPDAVDSGMLPEMRVHVTVGVGIPSAEHVMLSDVLYSLSSIAAMIGLTVDNKHTHTHTDRQTFCAFLRPH